MLGRTDFASWKQRIRLYCRGKENKVNILKSIDEGPFQMGIFRETLAYNADIRATNILLQGLPKDIYSLINHYTDAKDIWDNVKMLLEGSELTKEDHESQLYDDFEHFRQHKGETIHDYYVRFAKLINDMRNIKMTMSRMQLNSKFVNNMLPEWGRFVTAVKLNRGLRDSNYDQLYAYLKQHEAHANENKMMLDRFTQHTVDPLALMSNVAPQQYNSQSSTNPSSTYSTVQDGRVVVQNVQGRQNRGHGNNARGAGTAGYGGALNRVGNANPGQARQVKCYNCNGEWSGIGWKTVNILAGGHDTLFGPSYDSDILSEIHDHDHYQDVFVNIVKEHDMHDEVDDGYTNKTESVQIVHMLCKPKPYYNELNKIAISYKNPLCLTHAKQVQLALYNGYEIVKNNYVPAIVHNIEDTLEIAKITRRKIYDKMKDPECVTHKVKIAPPDYSKENYLATFAPQKQLTPEQIFWSQDTIKMKEEVLKEQTTASRPTKSLTVYPPNTPVLGL
ncbi:hypothetical protein Tco_0530551 [Tanacetum coccineum]